MYLPRLFQSSAVCAVAAVLWCCAQVSGAPIQPFDAVVQGNAGEDVYARSGPGKERFYPTLKLKDGQRVRVLRKDPGGWFMIEPPEGSFSWILAEYVAANGNQGTVKKNSVVVRVGAFNSKQRDVEQVRLNKDDTVEILGEETFEADRSGKVSQELWYKIKPPRNEYRWVKGSSLIELNPDGSEKVVRSKKPTDTHSAEKPAEERGLTQSKSKLGDSHTAASPIAPLGSDAPRFGHAPGKQTAPDDSYSDLGSGVGLGTVPSINQRSLRQELQAVTEQMQEMRKLPEIQWDLTAIESQLLGLQQATAGTPLTYQVEKRLWELRRDKLIHQDAIELAHRQQRGPAYSQLLPNPSTMRDTGPDSSPFPADPSRGNVSLNSPSRFQGAGVIARMRKPVPNVPRYVLLSPTGELLCYLESEPGLDLERYVGQSMGLNGQRGFDQRLGADRLRIQQLTPVRLAK